jgi:Flp pilus assembly protein TadB
MNKKLERDYIAKSPKEIKEYIKRNEKLLERTNKLNKKILNFLTFTIIAVIAVFIFVPVFTPIFFIASLFAFTLLILNIILRSSLEDRLKIFKNLSLEIKNKNSNLNS